MHMYTTHQSTRCSLVVSDVVTVTNIKRAHDKCVTPLHPLLVRLVLNFHMRKK
jgi:hypothetical protein